MANFSAYFDASGTKRLKAMAFAGFVSRIKKWERFNVEWARILARYGVSTLHMTDFASSSREYAPWKGDTERRRKFISDLVSCIKSNTNKGFSSGIYVEDYNDINSDFFLAESIGQPYTLCGYACLGALGVWSINKCVRKGDLLIFIEEGDEDQGEFMKLGRSQGFSIEPLTKSDASAFQAGDLVGWKCRTVLQEALKSPLTTEEQVEQILSSLRPLEGTVQSNKGFDSDSLYRLCTEKEIPRRSGALELRG
jgi:hypothetical protein